MAKIRAECKRTLILTSLLLLPCIFVAAEDGLEHVGEKIESVYLTRIISFLQRSRDMVFPHVWPDLEFGWRIVLGTVIGFLGAALGSVGGVGGGGIFVPMLTLVIGFDPKSSTAVSKCMITGAALASVYYNLKLRHPTLDLPIIDYNLALLFQPMLVLGISIGVFFNVIFAEWMVIALLIVLFIGTSTKAFFKGVETWKKETMLKKELAARRLASDYTGNEKVLYKLLPGGPTNETRMRVNEIKPSKVSIFKNVLWKEVGILFAVWTIILVLHISKDFTALCSPTYWTVTLLQIPVAIGPFGYQAVCLYQGLKVVESTGDAKIVWTVPMLILCCICGMLSGIVGGLLGLGGGFIIGPLLLELGIPPQVHFFLCEELRNNTKNCHEFRVMYVYEHITLFGCIQCQVSSATATFIMAFSSSMSVIQYYLYKRFPPSYALYFVAVATIAALVGQSVVRKMISLFRRASLIIFVLAFTIFISAIFLGWVGVENIIGKVHGDERLWFYNICEYVP